MHRGLILWGGWLITCAVFFSLAGFFHQYYLAMLGAPIAAIVAIGAVWLWRLRTAHRIRAALHSLVAGAAWSYIPAKILATGAVAVWSYVTNRLWIFTERTTAMGVAQ